MGGVSGARRAVEGSRRVRLSARALARWLHVAPGSMAPGTPPYMTEPACCYEGAQQQARGRNSCSRPAGSRETVRSASWLADQR